jgi:hypothetical protein
LIQAVVRIKPYQIEGVFQQDPRRAPVCVWAHSELPGLLHSETIRVNIRKPTWPARTREINWVPSFRGIVHIREALDRPVAVLTKSREEITPELRGAILDREIRVCCIEVLE